MSPRRLGIIGCGGIMHEIAVQSACGDFTVRLNGRVSPDNAMTSLLTGYSVAREIINRAGTLVI
jgi:aspartate dehydrogenase